MHRPIVKTTTAADADAALAALTLAFSADPAVRWMYSDPFQFAQNFPGFARAFGGRAFAQATACSLEEHRGVSLWLPPGVQPDEGELVPHLERTVASPRLTDVFAMFQQMDAYHPKEPHWYLPLIGVDPAAQGRGLGSLLLEHTLGLCDRDHVPAYLEASNARNVPLYERHGFEVMGRIQAGSSSTIYPMLRPAR